MKPRLLSTARLSLPLASALAALLSITAVHATPYTWTSTTAGARSWIDTTNWAGGFQYVSDPANELIFFADITTNIAPINQTFTNVPAALSMNTLTLNGKGAASGASSSNITIGSSASTWTIGDGTTSTVNLNAVWGASGAANIFYTVAANLTLNQATTLFTGNGTAGVFNGANDAGFVFSGNIGQAASGHGITKSGSSRLTLSGSSLTFTGPMTVNGGSLFLTGNSNPGFAMTVNTGAILRIGNNTATQIGTSGNYSGNISTGTGGTLQLWSTSAQEFSGIISGSGTLNKAYGGTLTLSGANTYTGRTSFQPQTAAGFTVNVSSFNSVVGGTASSSLGAPTTVANGTVDIGSGTAQAGVNLTYVSTATGETTDRVMNIVFNANSSQTITANNTTGLLRFTSAFTSSPTTGTGRLTLTGTGAGQIDQGIPQLSTGGLDKSGTGTWTLGGSGIFTGPTKINAGTLSLSSATALQNSPFDTTSVVGAAAAGLKIATTTLSLGGLTGSNALDTRFTTALGGPSNATAKGGYSGLTALSLINGAGTVSTYSGNIVNGATGMTLTKSGGGTQFLNGTNSHTGLTTVNGGTLGSGTGFSGAVTASTGGILSPGASAGAFGTLAISDSGASALTLNGGYLQMDVSTASKDLIAVTGNTVVNGTNTVVLNPTTGVAAGTYDLVTHAATTGTGSVVFANGSTTLGNATLAVNAGNIRMTVGAGGLNNSVWVGTTATWDSGTNWNRNGTAGSAFSAGDFVTIDDTGSNAANITSAATVSPAALTVNNSTKSFVITAAIGGTGTPLVKLGTNQLTLGSATVAPANSYSGGTVVLGGILNLAGVTNANVNYLLGDAAGGITLNGGRLQATGTNVSGARSVTVLGGGGSLFVNKNNSFTTSAILTGSGTLNLLDGGGSGTLSTYSFNSTSNDFTGGLVLNNAILNVGRLDDSSNNIVINSNTSSATGNVNSTPGLKYNSGAASALTLSSRAIEFNSAVTSAILIQNNSTTYATTISSDLVASGAGTKTLMLDAAAGPTNVFEGDISNGTGGGTVGVVKPSSTGASGTASTSVWVLSGNNSYTGATAINTGTLAGIGANAFGSTSGISIAAAGILSLRGDSSTIFASSNLTTSATAATINVDRATIAGTGAKTMTMGTLGTTSTAATYQVNFSGSNNTSLSIGAVTGAISTAAATVTLSNAIASTGELTLASYTSANTTGGETVTFTGAGNTTVTGNVTPSATVLALTKSGTGNLSLNGTNNTFTGTIRFNSTTTSDGTVSYASASGTNPITFATTTGFNSTLSYTGAAPLTMSGLISATALTTGGINLEANGVTSADTINYSNASSFSTFAAGTKFINFGGANTGDNIFAGSISNSAGTTSVIKQGTGKWVLTGTSNFNGGFFVNEGTVSANTIAAGGTSSAIGANTRINLGRDNNTGTLIYTGGLQSTNRDLRIGGPSTASGTGGSTILNDGTGALTFSATTFNTAQTGILFNRTLTLGGSYTGGVNEIQGTVQDNTSTTGLVNLEKTGDSTWKLSGANSYTGTTNVTAGKLIVSGNISTSSLTTVSTGATLGGTGSIGAATINGNLAPGNSIGTLTATGDVTWNDNNAWVFELGLSSTDLASAGLGSNNDLLNITGGTSDFLKGTGSSFTFDFGGGGAAGWYKLVDWAGTTNFVDGDFFASNLNGSLSGTFKVDAGTSALYLNVIPEPRAALLCGIGLLMLLRRRR